MPARVQIPFSFNYPSSGNLVPAAGASVAVYTRNSDGSQGSPAAVYQAQAGNNQYASLQTDAGGNVPGWVNEGTYKIVAAASGGFGGGTINFDALYGGGTFAIGTNAVDTPQLSTNVQSYLVPVGTILDHGASSPPAGYLNCDGTTVSQTTYANLFASIGTTWNTGGEPGGTFRLPNLIGAMTVGKGTASWGTIRTLGKYGLPSGGTYLGEETHVLTPAELAAHTHSITDPTHGHSVYDPSHTHGLGTYVVANASSFGNVQYSLGSGYNSIYQNASGFYAISGTGAANTGISLYWASTGITGTNNNTGGGGAHNNMPPFAVVNKIIKY